MEIDRVQKWVMSALMLTTAVIFAVGLALLAANNDRPGAKPGLLIIAGAVGLLAFGAARVIHQKSVVSPWLLVGVLPAAVGWYFVLVR
jgi:FtsH-binding integral membrane protein